MPKSKKPIEPISIDLSPLNKNPKLTKEKLGLIPDVKNRKMVCLRMRPELINLMNDIIKKLKKRTKTKYSQSSFIEMTIVLASKATIAELLDSYGETFKL